MARAVADLVERGEAVTSRALAAAAHISREHSLHLARDRWKRARWRRTRCHQFCE